MSVSRRSFLNTVAHVLPAPFLLTSKTLHADSLDQQIGNMLLVNFSGLTAGPDSQISQLIRQEDLGGVLLFENNFSSAVEPRSSLKSLCSSLQAQSPKPLFIAMDQEGGSVNRLKKKYGFPQTRSASDLGRQNDPQTTFKEATVMAKTLAQLGVNLNFAPVVDININPDNPVVGRSHRCFGDTPETVVRHASEFIRAHRQQHVLTTLKHFPGHGSSASDSHNGLTEVTGTWTEIELQPYRSLFSKGYTDAVMTAHIFNRHWDEHYPASLSRQVVTGMLRKTLRFDGLVISDDLLMGAIREYYSLQESVRLAVNAGVDMLLFTTIANDLVPHVKQIIRDHVKSGRISKDRIAQANRRINRLKAHLI